MIDPDIKITTSVATIDNIMINKCQKCSSEIYKTSNHHSNAEMLKCKNCHHEVLIDK